MKKNTLKSGAQLYATDSLKLIHGIEVYQTEFEMQNEELFKT